MKENKRLRDIGEKEIIRSIIKPLFNPNNKLGWVGDDCAVIKVSGNKSICLSTDRVPADLISFKLGLIDYFELGYYLVVLNISDIVANGAIPVGILLNLAFNEDFLIEDFEKIIHGAKKACDEYGCNVLGGDLSNSIEMNLCATSIGIADTNKILYRRGSNKGDYVFCSDCLGLTSTAFNYFLKAKPNGLLLTEEEEKILINQFKKPKAKLDLSKKLLSINHLVTCMDNTDGIGQSYIELSEINGLRFELNRELMPIHELSFKIAEFLQSNILDIVLGGGADFQIVGTIEGNMDIEGINDILDQEFKIIGKVFEGSGLWIREKDGHSYEYNVPGWNYYSPQINKLLDNVR